MNLKLKVFVERNLSFVEASWQPFTRTNRSPQSPFLIVEMVYFVHFCVREVRSSGIRASIAIVDIRNCLKYSKISFDSYHLKIAKRSISR